MKLVNAMLDAYMYTNDFTEMLGEIVYNDAKVKAENEKRNELIANLGLSFETYDPILCSINAMMARAIKVAYKKGFQDSIEFIMSCTNTENDSKEKEGLIL